MVTWILEESRGTYRMGEIELPLPPVRLPEAYLHQEPRSAVELQAAADWFVWRMDPATGRPLLGPDGKPSYNQMFAHLRSVTVERRGPLIRGMLLFLERRWVRRLIRAMGVDTPYTGDAVLEIAKLAFGSVIRPDYADRGMQYFYEVVAPVYELFHQFTTGAVPLMADEDFVAFGPLPLGVVRTERLRPEALLYPNDAVGRDGVAAELVAFLASLPPAPRRILAVGDGPGLTAFKTLIGALHAGLRELEIVVLERNRGQIANGRRAWAHLMAQDVGPRLAAAGLSARWEQGSGDEDRFPAGSFDAAFSTYVVGAMGTEEVVAGYGRATLRALAPGGRHVVLDFYDRNDDPSHAIEPVGRTEARARASARWMARLSDPQLRQTYEGIWDHHVGLNGALDRASIAAGASFERTHRQTRFAHIPLLRLGKWTLTFSFSGYNERRAVYTAPAG